MFIRSTKPVNGVRINYRCAPYKQSPCWIITKSY